MIRYTVLLLFLSILIGTILFIINAERDYNINSGFTSIPLNYDPYQNDSTYIDNGIEVHVTHGFVKGIQHGREGDHLLIRALSPLPTIEINNLQSSNQNYSVLLENINPDLYASSMTLESLPIRINANTLKFNLSLTALETKNFIPAPPQLTDQDRFIVLGDSRDGYETFQSIINQINGENPLFVIDNGDLVYSGKPNQYRIFDHMVNNISTTLCTTLGNHDIRDEGRGIYTKLYGPAYYSFDLGNKHFIFLDSSEGFASEQAISDEQYTWLESDLIAAQGKDIFVVSHIPSTDPRPEVLPNDIQTYIDEAEQTGGSIEKVLDKFEDNMAFAHGFRTTEEANRFEGLMTTYHVNTVYESHIHSYFDFTKNDVRYIISGGGGAELLSEDSYYHYLIVKTSTPDLLTIVNLPSPANLVQARYIATFSLFAEAMYVENKAAVTFYYIALILIVLLLIMRIIMKFKEPLTPFWISSKGAFSYFKKEYKVQREIYKKTRKKKHIESSTEDEHQ